MYAPSSVAQAAIPNPDQITQTLARIQPDAALQQYATMHKNDPYIMSLAVAEFNRRQALRAQPVQGQQPTVVNQDLAAMAPAPMPVPRQMPPQQIAQQQRLPEQQGIGALPARNIENMADGGIAGYADDEGPGYADRGAVEDSSMDIFNKAIQMEGVTDPAQVAFAKAVFDQESRNNVGSKTSHKGAVGGMQVMPGTFNDNADKGMRIDNPLDNARVGIRYAIKGLKAADGDPKLAAVHYYSGPGGMNTVARGGDVPGPLNKETGKRDPSALEYAAQLATRLVPIGEAQAETRTAPAAAAPATAPAEGGGGAAFGMYPSAARGAKATPASEARITEQARQAMLGVGELPYDILGMPMDVGHQIRKVLGSKVPNENIIGTSAYLKKKATEAGIREADVKDPSLQKWRTAGEVAAAIPAPGRAPTGLARLAPAAEAAKVAKAAEAGVEADVAGIAALSPVQEAAQATRVAKQAAAQKQAAPQVGARPPDPAAVSEAEAYAKAEQEQLAAQQVPKSPAEAWAAQQQQDLAAIRPTVNPAAAAVPARGAPLEVAPLSETAQINRLAPREGGVQVSPAAASQPVAENAARAITDLFTASAPNAGMSIADQYAEYGRGRQFAENAAIPPEVKKEAVEAAKEEIPKSERKGFGYEDLMMFGLQLLASKSPYFGQAVGEAGVGAIGAKMAREKGETERIKEQSMADYYKEHGAYLKSEAARKAEEDKPLAQARKEIAAELLKLQSNTMYQTALPEEKQAMERKARQAIMGQYPELAGTLGGTGGADFRVLGSRPS